MHKRHRLAPIAFPATKTAVLLLVLLKYKVLVVEFFSFLHLLLSRSSKRKGHRSMNWSFERNQIIALIFEASHFMWNSTNWLITRATPGRSLIFWIFKEVLLANCFLSIFSNRVSIWIFLTAANPAGGSL